MKETVAISTDYNYITPVETLIKSIAYHNQNVDIYVINEDIPQEWFININQVLKTIQIHVLDAKFDPAIIEDEKISNNYLSKLAYGRILIPQLVPAKRVLYLDADIIVNGTLEKLFNYDLGDYPMGAVPEYFNPEIFNSGVLLINNARLKETDFVHNLLEAGKNSPADNDQTILNEAFKDNYQKLPGQFNVQIGGDLETFYHHDQLAMYKQKLQASSPYLIIHYTTAAKPWNTTNCLQLRELWWQYKDLEYDEIIARQPLPPTSIPHKKGTIFTFTNSQDLKNLYELAQELPEYEFHVGAYSLMGYRLIQALEYPNVKLHPTMTTFTYDQLLDETDIYLDINYGAKNNDILQQFIDRHVPVLSFNEVATKDLLKQPDYHSFDNDDLDGMIKTIQQLSD